MPRQNSSKTWDLTPAEREQRRRRVLNQMAVAAADPAHQRAMFRAKVAGQLTALIAQASKSAAQVARSVGVSASQISRQLSGKTNLTLDTVYGIAAAAGATVDMVFASERVTQPSQQDVSAALSAPQVSQTVDRECRIEVAADVSAHVDRNMLYQLWMTQCDINGGAEVRLKFDVPWDVVQGYKPANESIHALSA